MIENIMHIVANNNTKDYIQFQTDIRINEREPGDRMYKIWNRGFKLECLKSGLKIMFKTKTRNKVEVEIMDDICPNKRKKCVKRFRFQIFLKGRLKNTVYSL